MKYEKLAEAILALLNGMNFQFKMYKGVDGKRTSNPYEARYFYVNEPNIMFIIDETSNTLSVHKAGIKFTDFKDIHQAIRSVVRRYFINLEIRDYNKSFSPKDFSPVQMKKDYQIDQINESIDHKRVEIVEGHGNILEMFEEGDVSTIILNGEESVTLPYRKDQIIPVIFESTLRKGYIDKSQIISLYKLHESIETMKRKLHSQRSIRKLNSLQEDYKHLF